MTARTEVQVLSPPRMQRELNQEEASLTEPELETGFSAVVAETRVTLLHDGAQCFPAMFAAIEAAKTEILLEMYWFGSDTIGQRFAAALSAKARDGVRVQVTYDAIGSLEADDGMFDAMREAGVEVSQFNPIAPWRHRFRIARVSRRNHRKILIVDGTTGFTGGVNIGDPWMSVAEGGEGWRDDMVRLEGPAAADLRQIFRHGWAQMDDTPDADKPAYFVDNEERPVRILANHYFGERRAIRGAYLRRIAAARHRVFLTNSYFLPDRVVRNALAKAAARGVDVRVLLPGISDVAAVYFASRKLYRWFYRRGVSLHEWHDSVLHSKTAVIDGTWCTIGTYNLDNLSWRSNLEVTASFDTPVIAAAVEQRFLEDIARAPAIDPAVFQDRPWIEKLLERFFFMFRKFL